MRKRDPYEVLGIRRDATQEEAKKRFRILALQFHPDRNPGDKTAEARFKEIEDAWSQLEHRLPRSAVPLEIPEGASEEEIEDAYVKWLLDPRNSPLEEAAPKPPPRAQAAQPAAGPTAAGTTAPVVRPSGQPADWRRVKASRYRAAHGLERISPEQAARLLDSHPNAFAVLKLLQQRSPELCLYGAILGRARRARAVHQFSTTTALVIAGTLPAELTGCEEALQDPMASVEAAQEDLARIAPQVKIGGTFIPLEKLTIDMYFLKENIRELSALLPKGASRHGGGTSVVPQ